MAVPVPVDISVDIPDPYPATTVEYPSGLLTVIVDALSGAMHAELLTGKVGGSVPTKNVGPWLNGTEWYYWVPGYGYQPTQQGLPVGAMAIWGGGNNIPVNWILCEGQGVSTTGFARLFSKIGYTWGGSGGTFNLPPAGVFFLNAPNFVLDSRVPVKSGPTSGPNVRGGSQSALIPSDAMPALQVQLLYLNPEMIDNNVNIPNTQGAGTSGYYYPVTDESGNILGTNQKTIAIMPPFAAANFIIKYA